MSSRGANRELVFCHECENEWYRDEHGLECPECSSDFVEVVQRDHDPRNTQPSLASHNPWQTPQQAALDPDEEDISAYDQHRHPMADRRPPSNLPPGFPPNIFGPFHELLSGMGGQSAFNASARRGPHSEADLERARSRSVPGGQRSSITGRPPEPHIRIWTSTGPNHSFTMQASSFGPRGDPSNGRALGNLDMNEMLSSMLNNIGAMHAHTHHPGATRGGDPFSNMLSSIFGVNPNMNSGDYIADQAAFDRIMSQLMDQHATGNAPAAAPTEAIHALPRRPIKKEDLGDNGKAQCPVCIADLNVGEEVVELPCHHLFHFDCVEPWLAQHDTCPNCRHGIVPKEGGTGTVRRPDQQPLNNQDPTVLIRQQSGGRDNPIVLPESPTTDRRRRRRRSLGDGDGGGGGSSGGLIGRARNLFSGSGSGGSGSRR